MQAVCRTDALVEQIPCKKRTDLFGFYFGFGKSCVECQALHFAFCFLPRLHAKTVAGIAQIEELSYRPVCLFAPCNTCRSKNFGSRFDYVFTHSLSPPWQIFCADFALLYQAVLSNGKVGEKCENYFYFLQKIEKNSLTSILLYVILILGYLAEPDAPILISD